MTTTVADVEQAYLSSKLEENVYVRAPKGLEVHPGHVLKLLKAIYGMPQAGREFWKLLRGIIMKLGFTQSEHALCFFYRRTAAGFIILMTYVDDITITTDCEAMRNEVFAAINEVVMLDDRGVLKSFLGKNFEYNADKQFWHITQGTYIKDLCASMDLHQGKAKAAHTPEIKQVWSVENSTAKDDAERLRVSVFSSARAARWAASCGASCAADRTSCTASRTRRST